MNKNNAEKMIKLINQGCDSIEDLLFSYISNYPKEFPLPVLIDLINTLHLNCFYPEILKNYAASLTAKERAMYLKAYLEGKMYLTKKDAEKNVSAQIQNAQAIIDAYDNIN